jgi:hypothetical protein
MRLRAALVGTLAFGLLAASCGQPADEDRRQIRAAFLAYRTAALSGDGATAAALLSSMTANHLGWMRDLALHGPLDELVLHPTVNQLLVLRLRQFVPAEELRAMSGAQVLALALSRGWLGRDVVANVELGGIEVHGDGADAELVVSGRPHEWRHLFLRENGGWRFELMQAFGVAESEYGEIALEHGVSGTDVALVLVRKEAGEAFDRDRLLRPLLAEASESVSPVNP